MRAFGERLAAHLGLPVELWDERLTTVEAERTLRAAGMSRARSARSCIDQEAAAIILESYLARPA